VSANDADNRGSSPPLKVETIDKKYNSFNELVDSRGAHQYPYEEYGERREERLAVKTQNPAFGGRGQAPYRERLRREIRSATQAMISLSGYAHRPRGWSVSLTLVTNLPDFSKRAISV
jgi:hypothetical protein